ncbi:hypothetical protein LTR95_007285 [Oleoguttula sp. CCFEE 5521]
MLSLIASTAVLMTAASAATLPSVCGKTCARAPPAVSMQSSGCYKPAPKGFEYGHWYRTYQSLPGSEYMHNIELFASPGATTDVHKTDFITFQVPGCDHIYSIYGYETYTDYTDVKTFHGTGTLEQVSGPLEIVAYGWDTACDPYIVYWEPGPTGDFGLTTMSSSPTGPTLKTFTDLVADIKALGHDDLTAQADKLDWIPYDGARKVVPYPQASKEVLENKNMPDASGKCPTNGESIFGQRVLKYVKDL